MDVIQATEAKQLNLYRKHFLIGGPLFLSWWLVSVYVSRNAWDDIRLRVAVCAVFLTFWVLSYKSEHVRKNVHHYALGSTLFMLASFFYIIYRNNVSVAIGSAMYVVIVASTVCLHTLTAMIIYDIVGVIIIFIMFANVTNPGLSLTQVLYGFISVMLANHIALEVRKRLEGYLRTEVDNFSHLLDSTFEGLAIVKDKVIIRTNSPFDEIFKTTTKGRRLDEFMVLQPDDAFETTGYTGSQRIPCILKVKRKPMKFADDQVDLFSLTDITVEREKEAKLANANKLASLGEIAGGLAHEINSPLALINFSTALIDDALSKDSVKSEVVEKQLNVIQKTVDRISRIIWGLRQFSRDGSRDKFDLVPTNELFEDVLSFCLTAIKEKHIHLEKKIDPFLVYCQRIQIEQVLLNLINNAIYALGQVPDQKSYLTLTAKQSETSIFIIVEDNGIGIKPEVREKLFQPFFTTKPIGAGTGLGLSISKGIIDLHQGQIYVDTSSGTTQFVIELPKQKIH